MKRFSALAALAIATVALGAATLYAAADQTIVGKIVDSKCKETDTACIIAGARAGDKLTFRAKSNNRLYGITGSYTSNNNALLIPFIGKTVSAKGQVQVAGVSQILSIKTLVVVP